MKLSVDRSRTKQYSDEAGKRYFSITEVLRAMCPDQYVNVPLETLEQAARKGKIVHHWFALYMYSRAGICAAPPVLPEYEGYCRAILMWADANKPDPCLIETSSVWPGKSVAGTPDLLCLYGLKNVPALIELKTTVEKHRTHKVQVNVQRRLSGYEKARVMRLLYVARDGSYEDLAVEPDPIGEAAFLNTVNLLTWRNGS